MLQNTVTFVFTFLMIAWLVWFAVLPLGIKREEQPEQGNDHGAPQNPRLWYKLALCSVIALVLTTVFVMVLNSGLFEPWKSGAENYIDTPEQAH